MSSNVIPRAEPRIGALLLCVALGLGLAACGGGGSGGGSGGDGSTPPPVPVQAAAIVTQPASQSAGIGAAVTFSVGATGTNLRYQWRRDGRNIAGATAASYTLNNVQAEDDGSVFTVAVANSAGSVVSAGAALRVAVPKGLSLLAGRLGGPGNLDGQHGRFMYPGGVTIGPGGVLYVTDSMFWPSGPGKLRTVDPATGTIATVHSYTWGTFPWVVRFDGAGNRYEMTDSAVYKTTGAGVRTLLAGSDTPGGPEVDGTGPAARFRQATDMAIDGAGNLYVTDQAARKIRKIDPAGKVVTLAGNGVGAFVDGRGNQASFRSPARLAVDGTGNVFVVDLDDAAGKVRKVAPDGMVTTLGSTASDGTGPHLRSGEAVSAIAVDGTGNLYVTDQRQGCRIFRIAPGGTVAGIAGSATATGNADGKGDAARFCTADGRRIESLTMDAAGNLILLDSDNATLRRVTPSGEVTTLAGRASGAARSDGKGPAAAFAFARLPNPSHTGFTTGSYNLAADAQGNVYVGEGDRIRKVSGEGDVGTLPPVAGAPAAARYFTSGLNHGGGAVVVADNVVSRVDANGTLHFLAGRAGAGHGRHDGKGAGASFENPYDLTVDGLGNVYLRDVVYAGTMGVPQVVERKITPEGVVTTLPRVADFDPATGVWHADGEGNLWSAYPGGALVLTRPGGSRQILRVAQADKSRLYATAITRDAAGNLYVAERMPDTADVPEAWHAVRRIAPDGTETLVAGTRGSSGVRLGSPGSLGRVDALAAGADGTLYLMTENAVLRLKP